MNDEEKEIVNSEVDLDEEVELEEVSDEELLDAFTTDDFKSYLREINKYPILSYDDTIKYYNLMKNGSTEAADILVKSNLRLVVSVAFRYRYRLKKLDILDIIQEGNIGLMKAVGKFDPSRGALSTVAVNWIRQAIGRAIYDKDDTIRKPVHMHEQVNKYRNIVEEAVKDGTEISDAEICKRMKIDIGTLNDIKYTLGQTVVSMNARVNSDDDSDELEYFISDEVNSFNEVDEAIVTNELVAVLKTILKPNEYYIIFERILFPRKSLEELGAEFYLTRERIRQLEAKVCDKVKPYMVKNSMLFRKTLDSLRKSNPRLVDNIRIEPIAPVDYIKYLFIKNNLTDIEEKVYRLKFLSDRNFTDSELCNLLNLSFLEYKELITSLKLKMNSFFVNQKKRFISFKNNLLKSYGYNVYECSNDYKVIDYDYLSDYFSDMSYEDFLSSYGDIYDNLNDSEKKLIDRFYYKPQICECSDYLINKEINLVMKKLKVRSYFLPNKVLLKTFKANREYFTLQQQLFLECFLFSIKDKTEYYEKYGVPTNRINMKYFIDKLEKIHYGVLGILENSFDLKKYLSVKKQYYDKLGVERIKILDMYYGVNGYYSLKDIADELGIPYLEAHSKVRKSREFAISIYINHSGSINLLSKNKYLPYLKNKNFELTDDNREIVRLFVEDGLSYDDIASRFGLNNYKVSNIVTDTIRKIDMYRFGILDFSSYLVYEIREICAYYDWDELSIKIICDKYKLGLNTEQLSVKYCLPKEQINRISALFNKDSLKYKVRDVVLTKNDILNEINSHISDSVISVLAKKCLAYYFGIKCDFNPDGVSLVASEIGLKLGMSKNMVSHYIYDGERDIKLKKIGVLKPDLRCFSRDEITNILKDVHLPISDKEKELFYYLYELNGYAYKTLDELALIFGDSKSSIRRRVQRASLNIKKYLSGELKGVIHYDTDVIPILKYFDKWEKEFVIDYYRDKLTFQNIAKKYSLTFNQVVSLFDRINMEVYELLNDPNYVSFDFDYAEEVKDSKLLPFNGNFDIAVQIYNKFFRIENIQRKSISQIKNELKLECHTTAISNLLLNYMVAICKFRDGYININPYSYEEVLCFYNKYFDVLPMYKKTIFEKYLNRMSNVYVNSTGYLSDVIIYELMLENGDTVFDVSNSNKQAVMTILRKYGKNISSTIRSCLYFKFDISDRDLMNGKELNHVYRILDKILKLKKNENEHAFVLEKKD